MKTKKKPKELMKKKSQPSLRKAAIWAYARKHYPDITDMDTDEIRIALFQSLKTDEGDLPGTQSQAVRNGRVRTSVLPLLWQYDPLPPIPNEPLSYIQQYMQQRLLEALPSEYKEKGWYQETVSRVKDRVR